MSALEDDDACAGCVCSTSTLSSAAAEIVLFCVVGELDSFTIPAVQAGLADCLAQGPSHLVVDIAEVAFCSAWGLNMLVHTGRVAERTATSYAVSGASAQINRLWQTLWPAGELPIRYPTAAAAIVTAGQALRPDLHRASCRTTNTVAEVSLRQVI